MNMSENYVADEINRAQSISELKQVMTRFSPLNMGQAGEVIAGIRRIAYKDANPLGLIIGRLR